MFYSSNLCFIESQVTAVHSGLKQFQEVLNMSALQILPGIPQRIVRWKQADWNSAGMDQQIQSNSALTTNPQ